MGVKDQFHNSLCFAPQGNHSVHIASKAGMTYIFFLTDQEGLWCKDKFTIKDVCKRDTISQ